MGTWKRGDQPYGTFVQSSAQVHQGRYAGKLHYNFPTSQNDYVVFMQSHAIAGTPNVIRAWVYGDGSGHFLNVWVRDNGGQTWQVPLGQVSHSGWEQMLGRIQVGQKWPWTSIAGADNGRVDYPIHFAAIVLDDYPDTYAGSGTIYVDDLEAAEVSSPSPAATTETETSVSPPVAAPTGPLTGHIAFSIFDPAQNYYNVYVANPDGSGRNRVVEHARQPDISRDGRIVVNGEGGGTDSLWFMNPDGSQRHELGTHPEDSHPSWSPDSSRIAMGSTLHGDGSSRIYTYDSLTRLQKPSLLVFGACEMFGHYPTWMGDGRIVFTGCDYWVVGGGGSCGLFVVGSGGGQPVQITHGGPNDVAADDSGNQLAFMTHRDGNWEIYLTTTNGGEERNLTNNKADDGLPTWSPDGRWIAFLSSRGGTWAIWTMTPDGGNVYKLFDLGGSPGADWTNERISWGK